MLLFKADAAIIFSRDAPDILPDNPAFYKIRYLAEYRILKVAGKSGQVEDNQINS
jgi:hypothetical protein